MNKKDFLVALTSVFLTFSCADQSSTYNADRYDEEQAWMYGIWTIIDDFSDYQNYRDSETGEIMGMGFIETQTISIVPGEYISIYHSNPGEIVEWSKQKFLGANPSYARWYASEVDGHDRDKAPREDAWSFVIQSASGIQPIDAEFGLYADFENKRILWIYAPFEDKITIYGHKVKDYVY